MLVLQGGGALGAYQVGVYQALHEAGIEPDWVIGTSIGAINASLIAGSEPADRLDRLRGVLVPRRARPAASPVRRHADLAARWSPTCSPSRRGIPAFFQPNPMAFLGPHVPLGPDAAGYYDTAPLAGDA